MSRKRTLVHVFTWSSLVTLIIVVGASTLVGGEAAGDIGSVSSPVYVQSRPVYNKPTPKPKPKLVLPKQLQNVQQPKAPASPEQAGNPNLVTQTVYGFLDFVTTIGNTVMIFTPQTKKVEIVKPSAVPRASETVLVLPTQLASEPVGTTAPTTPARQPKLISMMEADSEEPEPAVTPVELESSEYEPQVAPTPSSTPGTTSDMAGLVSETPASLKPFIVTPVLEVQTQVSSVVSVAEGKSGPPKGFTLKLSKSETAPPAPPALPTGLISQTFETRVRDGVTTVHETKILGTFIGTQYARVLESSSSVLPFLVTASRPPTTTPPPSTTPKLAPVSEAEEIHTERSVVSSSDLENDERFNEELLEAEEGDQDDPDPSATTVIEPTPTASEEQTLYVLPQKEKKAQIYVSAVPSPNAYSRQPQIYVDISPAKSFDYIVTATPTRKQFRQQSSRNEYLNRFSNRFTNKSQQNPPSSSTESNELTERPAPSYDSPDDSAGRRPSRFRSRNRAGSKSRQTPEPEIIPTHSVYSNAVTATPSRRFTANSRTRNSGKNFQEAVSFKTAPAGRARPISPTSSSAIYRFKLNRPTGRWRFKPSPKPKVNIIRTKEEEDLLSPKDAHQSGGGGAVYPEGYGDNGEPLEIQALEETRTESNELGQDGEAAELLPQTVRVATITPSEFSDLDKYLEVATIRSPYVFQAGNVKNTRYITLTKTFTKEVIRPTQALAYGDPTLENILATRPPYERILEGSNDVATLPLIILGSDTATPPLETVTQTFSTTQLMLKTSILPVLYEGITTLYTLTQSYFVTRLVTAHKTVPPMELFQFAPSKSLTEFNTALQEAGSEHREQLLSSESDGDENENSYTHIVAAPDELTSVGSDFDPSSMDEKYPRPAPSPVKSPRTLVPKGKEAARAGLPDLANLTSEQLAFLRYFSGAGGPAQPLPPTHPMQNPNPFFPGSAAYPVQYTSSPVVYDTVTTIVESKTLRIQFGAKPTQTTIYSTRIVPTKVTSYVTASVPATPAIPNFFAQAPYPLAFVG